MRVIVQLASVWEIWTHQRKQAPFQDILEQITEEDLARVTVLYVSRNTKTPEAQGNEPQLRRRQRDAALVACERANALHDKRDKQNGRRSWMQITRSSTNMLQKDSRRSLPIRTTISIRKLQNTKASTRSSKWHNVNDHGHLHSTDGPLTAVATNVECVGSEFIRL